MSIKLVIFDLDGVLVDAKPIHYNALNLALPEDYRISLEEHYNIYDGRKTKDKLELLTKLKGLPQSKYPEIYELKQRYTLELISQVPSNFEIVALFETLEKNGYKIGVCSNSIRRTVFTALTSLELVEYCSIILSNEDVQNSKPHPEIYWKAMSMMGVLPEETVIVEDSPPGLLAADRSKANYIRVENSKEVTREIIMPKLTNTINVPKWKSKNLNVLIPMAGAGSRFKDAGYVFPKPLIEVHNKPMIQVVVENLGIEANYIFVVQSSHRKQYNLDSVLSLIVPNCKIVEVDGVTEGAACTALLAKSFIDNDQPLLFANSDQFVEWRPIDFMYEMQEFNCDGGIVTFKSTHPKWSFAKVDENLGDRVIEVAEKNPISDNATVGYYYWKKGSDFVKYAEQMITKNIRVNNEFYVCPVFNEAIKAGKYIRIHQAAGMWGLGTPEDLKYFVENHA